LDCLYGASVVNAWQRYERDDVVASEKCDGHLKNFNIRCDLLVRMAPLAALTSGALIISFFIRLNQSSSYGTTGSTDQSLWLTRCAVGVDALAQIFALM
jgi:hypothetical protein